MFAHRSMRSPMSSRMYECNALMTHSLKKMQWINEKKYTSPVIRSNIKFILWSLYADIVSLNGSVISWTSELRYLSVYIVSSRVFKCSLDFVSNRFFMKLFKTSDMNTHTIFLLNPTSSSTQRNLLRRLGRCLLPVLHAWRHWKRGSGLTSQPPLTSAGFLIGRRLAAGYCRGGLLTGGLMSVNRLISYY